MKWSAVFAVVLWGAAMLLGCSGDGTPASPSGDAGDAPSSGGSDMSGAGTTGSSQTASPPSGSGTSDDDATGTEGTDDTGGSPNGDCGDDAWIGVPSPPFGLHDTHRMYAGAQGYADGPNGPYTHWVDNMASGCSDAVDGSEDAPRCTIPNEIPAGAVVEIHGGPYLLTQQSNVYQFAGTVEAPAFMRGVGNVEIDAGGGENRNWTLQGSYFVAEGLVFVGGATVRLGGETGPASYYALRDSEIDFGERNCINASGSFGVIYNNEAHHCHRQPGPQDTHGVQVVPGSSNIWVVGNDIHHNFGNGIQWGHGAEDAKPDFVYVAGNTIHQDRETGVASKWSARSVISCNTIHGYRASPSGVEWCADDNSYCNTPSSGSAGQAIVSGADGFPDEEWIIYNTLYDLGVCLRLEDAARANYVGNSCADVLGVGLSLEKSGNDTQVLHNTFFNVGTAGSGAVIQQNWRDEFRNMRFENNIFHSTGAVLVWFEDFATVTPTMTWNSNIHWNDGSFTVEWRGEQTIASLSELEAVMAGDVMSFNGNVVGDPQLVDVPGGDFRPAAGSVAIGQATDALSGLDAEFRATFGEEVSIIPSCWNGGEIDIGAACAAG